MLNLHKECTRPRNCKVFNLNTKSFGVSHLASWRYNSRRRPAKIVGSRPGRSLTAGHSNLNQIWPCLATIVVTATRGVSSGNMNKRGVRCLPVAKNRNLKVDLRRDALLAGRDIVM